MTIFKINSTSSSPIHSSLILPSSLSSSPPIHGVQRRRARAPGDACGRRSSRPRSREARRPVKLGTGEQGGAAAAGVRGPRAGGTQRSECAVYKQGCRGARRSASLGVRRRRRRGHLQQVGGAGEREGGTTWEEGWRVVRHQQRWLTAFSGCRTRNRVYYFSYYVGNEF